MEVEAFVERAAADPMYFEKPYYLVPAKKAEKGLRGGFHVAAQEELEKKGGQGGRKPAARAARRRTSRKKAS